MKRSGYNLGLIFLLLVNTSFVDCQLQTYCPDGFIEVGFDSNKCFKLVELPGDQSDGLDWLDAKDICLQQPGDNPSLASITNSLDQAILSTQFNLQDNSWPLWIGYNRLDSADWTWEDGSTPGYENWQDGQPDFNDCAAMLVNTDHVGQWEALNCGNTRGYICQTFKSSSNPVTTPPPTTPHQCESDWTPYQGTCLKLQASAQTWEDAENMCIGLGGHLASVAGPEDNSALYVLGYFDLPVWIGYHKNASDNFEWSDGLPRLYTNFREGFPDSNNCTILTASETGVWIDTQCSQQLPFICRKYPAGIPTTPALVPGDCPGPNWIEYGQYCYYVSDFYDEFYPAESACQSEGANLVSIHNLIENEFVHDEYRKKWPFQASVWIGMSKPETSDNAYAWTDGTPLDYLAWGMGEPNNPRDEHCVEMFTPTNGGVFESLWNNIQCYFRKAFMCKYDKGSPDDGTLSSPTYNIVHNATFSTSSGQDLTTECAQLYSQQLNENAQLIMADVNSKIGSDICSGISTENMRMLFTTAPFISSGAMGSTSPLYLITTTSDLTLSQVHQCVSEISEYLAVFTNWPGGVVLEPEENCDSLDFDGSQFETVDNRYVCLGVAPTDKNATTTTITEEALLNYGITHSGSFTTDTTLSAQCLSQYNSVFALKTLQMAQTVGSLINEGQLCPDEEDVLIMNVSPLFMTSQGTQGTTTQRYIFNSTSENTFDEITKCGAEISVYLQSHSNWDQPILPPINGCAAVTFTPEMFTEVDQEWICRAENN